MEPGRRASVGRDIQAAGPLGTRRDVATMDCVRLLAMVLLQWTFQAVGRVPYFDLRIRDGASLGFLCRKELGA